MPVSSEEPPLSLKSRILETGASVVQDFKPVQQICAHLNAFHVYAEDPSRFETLPEEERKLWHSHVFEVKSGMLVMPQPSTSITPTAAWEAAETKEMEQVIGLYGKTYHFWQVDRGDVVPFGHPSLMLSFTEEGKVNEEARRKWAARDQNYKVSSEHKAQERAYIAEPQIHPDADEVRVFKMRFANVVSALSLFAPAFVAASDVIDLTPDNFDSVVLKSGTPSLVEFFAPWCGHCKNLAPIYEELATSLKHKSDKIQIAKVDADNHKELGKKFGVQGFPTLKYFDGKSDKPTEYSSGRDLESLQKFIADKTGVKAKGVKAAPSEVEMLTDSTFKEKVGKDQDVLVAFTAPWCGHCKNLAPVWEKVASDFSADVDVLIAKVDAESENSKATAQAQGVSSYPTIKFFPKGSTEPEPYSGPRTEQALVDFINGKAGTHRLVGGGLDAKAGTIEALDSIVKQYVVSPDTLDKITAEVKKATEGAKDKYAEYYLKVLDKLGKSEGYAQKESARLAGLLKKSDGLAKEKVDDLTKRSNILKNFLAGKAEDIKEEL
ncbi:putative disulfide isomerase [Phaeomoniella chlamydospora]|uniref:protein disulfide-isomerase n=1 Tax=Phaeomoniella chlamydospora TaxID=158046 RepID=A0A0G2E8K1_PHACM|nr:putative disulfide isomerase [Phaeomoniella chlamydospora]